MSKVRYDVAILGDSQPEGLLVAAGLVRKGLSVVIIPSSALDELPSEDLWPMILPAQVGSRRLDDLLFRAGFFRLEDSGLVASSFESQTVLKKNRLSFDGSFQRFSSELQREFPQWADTLIGLWESAKKSTEKNLRRAATEIENIQKKDPAFKEWMKAELISSLHPTSKEDGSTLYRRWLDYATKQGTKVYRIDPKLRQPFTNFLLDHCRKWGAHIWSEALHLKMSFSSVQLSPTTTSRYLILNGAGGGRYLSRNVLKNSTADTKQKLNERLNQWMYLDRIECPLTAIPEPLQEFCQIDFGLAVAGQSSERHLFTIRDPLRQEAVLLLGSWLPFEDNKAWVSQIEQGRQTLLKLAPFIPASAFKPIPSLLDLTEMRGECVRRGQADRLIPAVEKASSFKRILKSFTGLARFSNQPFSPYRRVFAVSPHYLPYRNRTASLEESLKLLDYFDKKRQKLSAAST